MTRPEGPSAETDLAIRVQSVSKQYRRTRAGFQLRTLKSALLQRSLTDGLDAADVIDAVQDVSFDVKRGESFGVIGGNGSGKSTLLKLVAGLMKPTTGTVDVRGRVAPLIELGAGFHPEISGLENIYINGAVLGLKRREIDQRIDDIVAFSGLGDFVDEPVKNYSSGMYVRLGFAVAVHTKPQVLLVDEVLAVGDEAFAHKCVHRIEEHLADGGTLLFVSHSLDLVERLCDRVLWVEKGVPKALGEPRKVIDAYRQAVAEAEALELQAQAERTGDTSKAAVANDSEAESAGEQERPEQEEDPDRWGSGCAVIERPRLLVNGAETRLVTTGDDVVFEFEVASEEPLTDFVFGVGITTPRGVDCWGTNTDILGFEPGRLAEQVTVRIACEELRLAAGEYDVAMAVHSRDGVPYDYQRKALSFVVKSSEGGVGSYLPKHTWSFSGDIDWADAPEEQNQTEGS